MRRSALGLVTVLILAGVLETPTAQTTPAPFPVPFDVARVEKAAATLPRLHSLLVSWRGSLVLERYFNGARATRPANIKSASKSIISALVGIAIDRRFLAGADQLIAPFFPDVVGPASEPARRAITIEHLLSMRSGLASTSNRNYGAWVQSPNWIRHALTRPLESPPGTTMDYSTGNSHILSGVLTRAVGVSTWRFAQEAIAKPLGFALARWPQDPQGVYFGGNDMLLTPKQMVQFGELYLNQGQVNGRQIVPSAWVAESFIPRGRSGFSDELYGYGWWIRQMAGVPAYYAWGFGGQFIFVIPALDLVVVSTSSVTVSDDRRTHRRTVDDLVEEAIVAPIAASRATR